MSQTEIFRRFSASIRLWFCPSEAKHLSLRGEGEDQRPHTTMVIATNNPISQIDRRLVRKFQLKEQPYGVPVTGAFPDHNSSDWQQ
jgi:hypothetical protein